MVNDLVQTLQKRQEMCQPLPQASSISQAASRKRSSPSLRAIGPVAGELLERVECAPKAADPEWALRENQHTSLLSHCPAADDLYGVEVLGLAQIAPYCCGAWVDKY